ncbi:MAG: hypothetical protein ACK4HD_05025, partial [Pannonibacter phragmitetus]
MTGSTASGIKRDPIIIDEAFEPQDGFGLYRGQDNPFLALKNAAQTAPVEIPQVDNSQAEVQLAELQKRDAQRYEMVPADQVEQWQAQWQAENASSGLMGDTKRLLQAGWAGLGTAAREVVGAIPVVGPKLQAAGDAVDEWLYGAADGALYERQLDQAIAGLTPETAQSREKSWWDSENGRLGPAWADPRSYFAGVVESLPGTIVTMGPSMALARGGFLKAMAAGASRKEASAIAARNALLAGAIGEGLLSGGQVSAAVRQQIGAMTEAQLASSEAVKTLMESGLSLQESIAAVTDDAATQSMIIGGVASGLFSGLGDRTLAKILAEGVGGGIVKRIVSGAGRGAVGEGLLEEAPQEAAQQIAQNIGVRTVDPSRDILQDVPEAMAGGLAVGGAMGAGMGGVGGAARPATTDGAGAASDDVLDVEMVQEPAPAQQPAPKKGPLSKAVERGLDGRQLPRVMIADPAVGEMAAGPLDGSVATIADDQRNVAPGMRRVILDDGQAHIIGQNLLVPVAEAGAAPVNTAPDGAPPIGANVRIDLPGADPVMARVESYEDGEAVIMDPGTGEIYQVPVDALTVIPERPMPGQAAPAPELPPVDLATMPGEPIPAEVRTSEPAPARDTAPVQEVLWNAPAPGQRAILTTPDGTRESVTIASYERDPDASAREALVRRADGTEVQVPVAALEVSKVLPSEQEKRDLKENPPVERETITGTNALAREVFGAQIVLPDERHARLYDLGKNRRDSKQILRTSQLDLDRAMPAEQEKLADEFGVSPQRLGQIADDYRYRVERAAKQSRSRTPVQMYPANETLIGRMQAEDRREAAKTARAAEPEPVPASVTDGALPDIWDRLPLPERQLLLESAKVKRAPKTKWEALTPQIREKLVSAQQAPKAAVPMTEAPAPAAAATEDEGAPAVADVPEADTSNIETDVDIAANDAATSPSNDLPEPTPAQKEAGNYKVGRIRLSGLDISIENPAGSVRSGTDADGETWSITMQSHYGYLRGTIGRDGDHIDVFVKPGLENIDGLPVVVVDQVAPDGSFDEHKVMLGFPSQEAAEAAYLANYTRGWKLGPVSVTTLDRFKDWLENGKTRLKASASANGKFFGTEPEKARAPQAPSNVRTVAGMSVTFPDHYQAEVFDLGQALMLENGIRAEDAGDMGDVPVSWRGRAAEVERLRGTIGMYMDPPARTGEEMARAAIESAATQIENGPATAFSIIDPDMAGEWASAVMAEMRTGVPLGSNMTQAPAPEAVTITAAQSNNNADTPTKTKKPAKKRQTYKQYVERLENYFRPGRDVKAYGGNLDRVIGFERTQDGWAVTVAQVNTDGTLGETRRHQTAPSEHQLSQWEKSNPIPERAQKKAQAAPQNAEAQEALPPAPASPQPAASMTGRPVRSPQQNFRENYAMSGSADLRSNPDLIEVADYADWLGSLSDAQWNTIGDRFTNLENPYLNAGAIDTASARAWLESALAAPDGPGVAETADGARAAPLVSENTIFTSDAAAAAREVLRRKLRQLNTGIDPEVMQAGITLAGYHIERGARTFAAYAAAMLRDLGETARPYLKSWYMGVKYDPRAGALDGMSSAAEVDAADINTLEAETDDVSGAPDTVEPDRPGPENSVDQRAGQPDGLPDVRGAERSLDAAVAEGRARQPDSSGLPDAGPLDAGAQGNRRAPRADRRRGSAPGTAGTSDARGNRRNSAGRVQSERQAGARLRQKAERRSESLTERQKQQAAADKVPVVLMDADNIAATLPLLSTSQHGDVLRTERRLYRDGGKGKMLTNGTGTGKTYSGLGVAKRVVRRGGDVLIVAPAGVLPAWEKGARDLLMEPRRLSDKKDAGGAGLNLTSFQNFRDNQELMQRNFAFVIYDESHHLMANMSGDSTAASVAHKAMTGHPEFAETRGRLAIQADYDAYHADETREVKKLLARGVPPERAAREVAEQPEFEARRKDMAARAAKISARLADEQARVNTKVLFLSASPFAGHKSVFYADGYLFDSRDGASTSQAYNTGSPEAQYLAANFGYRMRYNRANTPGPEVDIGVLERDWADRMFQSGAMTGRKIELDHDYSREFVVVEPGAGSAIDRAFQAINWKDYPKLAQQVIEWRKGGSDRQLTEALRARGSLDRIAKHLALGRKVVVFHERQQFNITNPFDFKDTDDATRAEIEKLRAAEPWIFGIDLSGLKPVPAAIGERFGDQVAYFSGLNKSTRDDELAEFNRDGGSKSIIVIQKDAGKEGLSAHDITGKHKRALMIMNTPVSPADAIQMEGRIYRHGLRSDAIIEYPTIQTSFEKIAYRETVSTRTSTAENLAMGSQARNLREAFREGYLDPAPADPAETQGTGGRQADQAGEGLSLFGRAKTYYFRRQKKTSKTKAAEGTDYFATPEPLGLKMVEWARLEPGERALEPSGGHGAIARWLPESTTNLALEPSGALIGELGIVTTGDVRQMFFEELNTANKFHAVVMNPPFGRGGATAIEHLGKAAEHLKDGGRIIAIYPSGPAADGLFKGWFYGTKNLRLAAEIELPRVTFDRAGTNVATRILVIDKGGRASDTGTVTHDLSNITDIGQLFDRIEGLELPRRPDLVITAKQVRLDEETITDDAGRQRWRASMEERHNAGPAGNVRARDVKKLAEKAGGEASTDTSRFWKVTHFDFDTEKDRQRFYASVLDAAEAKAAAAKEAAAEKAGERKFSQTGIFPQALELIDRIYKGAEVTRPIPIGQTPAVAKALGMTADRLIVTSDVLWKAAEKHALTKSEVISAITDAYDPLMVFSHESGSLNMIGRTVDRNGRPLLTAMKSTVIGPRREMTVTEITTVHGKDGYGFIGSWIDDGRLRYLDRSGAALWLSSTWANSSRTQSFKTVVAKLAAPHKGILTKDNL